MAFLDLFRGRSQPRKTEAPVARARFEAAEQGDDYKHWAGADAFAADAALSPAKRRTMRNRARHERVNNSYLAGISATLASDLIGTGPRLQLDIGDTEAGRQVERAFYDWGTLIDLPAKLRTMREALVVDGEAFALMTNNPRLPGVQLDLRLIEAEMVATPTEMMRQTITPEGNTVDGLEFDATGNVIAFQVLNFHPGSNFRINNLEFARVPAAAMIHWFRRIRPGQNRGMPEVTPALRLFGQLRRYTEAVIAAAETAADFAAFIHSNSPAAEVDEVDSFAELEIRKRALVTLPEGWDISQLKAEQPTSTYKDFKREILGEIARCLNIPFNVAALDSSSYNYASGRMDHQVYGMNQRVDRDHLERICLDRVFAAWVNEASLAGVIPDGLPPFSEWNWAWVWDGKDHVDPGKEANAAETRLRTLTTSLASEYARQGKRWDVELRQIAAERQLMAELGLSMNPVAPAAAPMPPEDVEAVRAAASVRAIVVHGPPASGKSTFVQKNKGPRDVVFDFDRIMQALSGNDPHQKTKPLIEYCLDIRDLIIQKAKVANGIDKTWVIVTRVKDEFRRAMSDLSPEYVHMNTSLEECLKRVDADPHRSAVAEEMKKVIRDYFAEQESAAATRWHPALEEAEA
jgi:lambda family phage portal protein